jgi:hypothetical protein
MDIVKHPSKEEINQALEILLNAKQIKYVKSRTFAGPSKIKIIRKLINFGIEIDKISRVLLKEEK